jgi:predicted ATPase/DNA-binding SARP family transcriptional activator
MMPMVLVGVLGPVVVTGDDGPVALASRRERALLAVLALFGGRVVDYDTLGDGVFGAEPPARLRHALATLVMRVRERLGPDVVETLDGGYGLNQQAVSVDAVLFETAVRSGDGLREALTWWRGRPYAELEGWPPADAGRVRLEELLRHAEEEVAARALGADDPGALVGEFEALVAAAPFRERRWVLLVRALYAAGRQADALGAFRRARTLLVEELGIEPGAELVAAERAVLAHESPTVARSAPTSGNLRTRATGLIGRTDDLDQIAVDVLDHRVVTLTGPGGVGKTVVALAVADGLRPHFPDGVWLVELAAVSYGGDIAATVAAALGVRHQAGATIVSTLQMALANQQLLIVVDNCEHVLDAAATLVGALQESCPAVRVLATSRERLDIADEYAVPVRRLATGGPESPAFALFVERAQRANLVADEAERHAVTEICERVDGLPLALELAAARCRAMQPTMLAERLRDGLRLLRTRHPQRVRHTTLTDVVCWSYDLLTPVEQTVLARLSMFAGGFEFDAAEAVAGLKEFDPIVIDDAVVSLVEKSLVEHDGRRYRLLETTREFARDRLSERNEIEAAADAHLAWFVKFALAAHDGLRGPDEAIWIDRLDVEWANLRAAFRHSLEVDDPTAAMTLTVALAIEAVFRRPDALGWADETLTRFGRPRHPLLRDVLGAAGFARWLHDDLDAASAFAREAFAQPTTPESDATSELLAEIATFATLSYSGRLAEALEIGKAALPIAAARHDPFLELAVLYGVVVTADMAGDRDELERASRRGGELAVSDNPSTRAYGILAESWGVHLRDPQAAAALTQIALELARSVRNTWIAQMATVISLSRSQPSADLAAEIALTKESLRQGWLTVAWQQIMLVARALAENGVPGLATEILAACRRSPSTATVVNTVFTPLCEHLRAALGEAEYDRLSAQGEQRDLPSLLRLLDDITIEPGGDARPEHVPPTTATTQRPQSPRASPAPTLGTAGVSPDVSRPHTRTGS